MKAIIFNSGLGSRMGKITENTHKAMVKLKNGETIFGRQLRILSSLGINDFIITTGPHKEQIEQQCKEFPENKYTFVENNEYDKTNYIYSMYLAKEFLAADVLLLHGDLVFNKELVAKMLAETGSKCLINEDKILPEKDFKARVGDGLLKEVSVNIFDEDCYAFQPLYKLEKKVLLAWLEKVEEYIKSGNDKVYAENALNEILAELEIHTMSYSEDYIDEIDTEADLIRVSEEIEEYENAKGEVSYNETTSF